MSDGAKYAFLSVMRRGLAAMIPAGASGDARVNARPDARGHAGPGAHQGREDADGERLARPLGRRGAGMGGGQEAAAVRMTRP